jgi:N-methylhydantoinase B
MNFNPVRLELIKNAIGSVVDEMVLAVTRVAYSSILKDTMDLSSAFCDSRGRMIAQGLSLPLHLGAIPDAMDAVLAKYPNGLSPGDVVVFNDPFQGGMHLPDIFMFKPVFWNEDELLGYAVLVAHHNDMGGRVPGSSAADSTEIYQEGLRIPPMKLYDREIENQTLIDLLRMNVRTPEIVIGDLQAQLAACNIAERGMLQLVRRFGIFELRHYFDELLDYAEREARRTISNIPDGTYEFTDYLDDDGVRTSERVTVHVTVRVEGSDVVVDLEGTSPQVRGAINSTLSSTKSMVYFAFRSLMDSDVPNNAGFFRPIKVVAPLGCVANVRSPGACAARGVTGFRIADATFGALAKAVPEKVRAAGEGGTTSYSFGGYDQHGKFFLFREAVMGAWGGGCARDGVDAIANPAANVRNTPVEVAEAQAPILIESYALVADTGGPGKWRGGMSVERQIRFLGEHATLQLRSDRRAFPPYGLEGGHSGAPSENMLYDGTSWQKKPTKITHPIETGFAIRHRTAGAGGYGDPLERDPDLVLADVRNGKVTPQGATRDYGVVLSQSFETVDVQSTARLRQSRKAENNSSAGQVK